jgi:hypothetical protein
MNPARQRALSARRLPGEAEIVFAAVTACNCGCDLPARFEFTVGGRFTFAMSDPVQIDALIEEMQIGREKLWGPKP